jgi:hypothetical protein
LSNESVTSRACRPARRSSDAPRAPIVDLRSRCAGVALVIAAVGCGPIAPGAEDPAGAAGRSGKTEVTITRTAVVDDPAGATAPRPKTAPPSTSDVVAATPFDPVANWSFGAPVALAAGGSVDAPLPLPTAIAATKHAIFALGRSRGGWLVREWSLRTRATAWSNTEVVATAFEDDVEPAIAPDGDAAIVVFSGPTGGVRVHRIESGASGPVHHRIAPRADGSGAAPARLGRVAAVVPLRTHLVLVGRDGDDVTLARLLRTGGFAESSARAIAKTTGRDGRSRSPRATAEEDHLLLAWDADDVPGALDAPGSTAAERANGTPLSPARRLTRPGFEAHAIDVVVELGACAVLASTPEGFEMFRFVRKGDDLGPYGGGLHLAGMSGNEGDVALATDVMGTLGVTPQKLLRIGPGIKIVPSPLGFSAQAGGSFDRIRLAHDESGNATALLSTKTGFGWLPTIARIEGERMGAPLPPPWVGPSPQRLLAAAHDHDESLAVFVDGGTLRVARIGNDGAERTIGAPAWTESSFDAFGVARASVPRGARAGGDWGLVLRDGRLFVATGPSAGAILSLGTPKGAAPNGTIAVVPGDGRELRLLWVPSADRNEALYSTTVDLQRARIATPWTRIDGTERHWGALGGARIVAAPRAAGGLYLLSNSGPLVPMIAQTFELWGVAPDGTLVAGLDLAAPAPLQEVALADSLGGPVVIAALTGKGVAAHFLDLGGPWRESFAFTPFRKAGDGPWLRNGNTLALLPGGAQPFDAAAALTPWLDKCPASFVTGARSLLMLCEEAPADHPLGARVVARTVKL